MKQTVLHNPYSCCDINKSECHCLGIHRRNDSQGLMFNWISYLMKDLPAEGIIE